MQVEQLFVETLIDIRQKLNSNPTEYHLLKVSSLLRQILLENLLEDASTATSLEAKFGCVQQSGVRVGPDREVWRVVAE